MRLRRERGRGEELPPGNQAMGRVEASGLGGGGPAVHHFTGPSSTRVTMLLGVRRTVLHWTSSIAPLYPTCQVIWRTPACPPFWTKLSS